MRKAFILLLGLAVTAASFAQTTYKSKDEIPSTQGTGTTRKVTGMKPRATNPSAYDQDFTEDNAMVANYQRMNQTLTHMLNCQANIDKLIQLEIERFEKTPEFLEARRAVDWYTSLQDSQQNAILAALAKQPDYQAARAGEAQVRQYMYAAERRGWTEDEKIGLNNKLESAKQAVARLEKAAFDHDARLAAILQKVADSQAARQKLEDDDLAQFRNPRDCKRSTANSKNTGRTPPSTSPKENASRTNKPGAPPPPIPDLFPSFQIFSADLPAFSVLPHRRWLKVRIESGPSAGPLREVSVMHTALSIGTMDCSAGSGVGADLKTFTVLGVYGMAVVTAVVARNTLGARGTGAVAPIEEELVGRQIEALADDLPINALKTGFLNSPAMADAVAESIRRHSLDRYVCDPVIHSHDAALADSALVHAYRQELLPLATVVTPNRTEAALLANMNPEDVGTIAGAQKAAEKIIKTGAHAVVIKGLSTGDLVTDLFFDGDDFLQFSAKRVTTRHTYGSGCLFSAGIAALLAQEIELPTAIDHARSFVSQAMEHYVKLGGGVRPVNVLALQPH